MSFFELVNPHAEAHRGARAGWLRAAVLGANDGLVSTASLMVGVAASGAAAAAVLTASDRPGGIQRTILSFQSQTADQGCRYSPSPKQFQAPPSPPNHPSLLLKLAMLKELPLGKPSEFFVEVSEAPRTAEDFDAPSRHVELTLIDDDESNAIDVGTELTPGAGQTGPGTG